MDLESGWIEYRSGGEPVRAWRARPAAAQAPLPAVLVIQEIWGVDAHLRDLVRRLAEAGYVALAPELYSRGGKPPELSEERVDAAKRVVDGIPPASWWDPAARDAAVARLGSEGPRLAATFGRLLSQDRPIERWLADLRAAVAHLRGAPEVAGRRVGSVGFCLGGALSLQLAASEPSLSAAVVFYGASPPPERAAAIRCPVLGLYGGDDPRVLATVPPFAEAMARSGRSFEQHVYPATPHAFFNDTRRSWRPEAARDAWWHVLGFLAGALAPA